MAILFTPFSYSYFSPKKSNPNFSTINGYGYNFNNTNPFHSSVLCSSQLSQQPQQISSQTPSPILIDKSFLCLSEAKSENELWAASCLRVRTFYGFHHETLNIQVSFVDLFCPLFCS